MERLLGRKFWLVTVVGYLAVLQVLGERLLACLHWLGAKLPTLGWLLSFFSDSVIMGAAVGMLVAVLFAKRTWRMVAALPLARGYFERIVFPDLNGEWDVELQSNWLRIDAMAKASASIEAPRYNPDHFDSVPLLVVKKKAQIDQNWTSVSMTLSDAPLASPVLPDPVLPDGDPDAGNIAPKKLLLRSETIAFDLLRDAKGRPQLAYVYKQENDPAAAVPSSDDEFLGAAFLSVDDSGLRMTGKYFQHQQCKKGFNAAGFITLTRPAKSFLRKSADILAGR